MSEKAYKYQAYEIGCDNRTSRKYRRLVKLRETKCYLIGEDGRKYRKGFYSTPGDWPMFRLDRETIKEIDE